MTGLHLAAYFCLGGNIINRILCIFDRDVQDGLRRTPLLYAAANGHDAVARMLLDKNAQIDITDTEYGHNTVVRMLLDKDAKVDTTDNNGRTPLSRAAANGHDAVVRMLLNKDAQVDTVDTR